MSTFAGAGPVTNRPEGSRPTHRVLLVDDSPEILSSLRHVLRRAGYEVHTASDGVEGLRLVRSLCPDVLILDVFMPHMGGLELAEAVRSDPELAGTFIVLITGMLDVERDIPELDGQADLGLAKPVDEDQLLRGLAELLGDGPPGSRLRCS